jgi:hypothetical protein
VIEVRVEAGPKLWAPACKIDGRAGYDLNGIGEELFAFYLISSNS